MNLIKQARRFLQENADLKRAEKEKAYLYSDLRHYGVSVGERRKFVKKHIKEIKALDKKEALDLVRKFWSTAYFEERAMALNILNIHAGRLGITDMPLIEKLMRESKGWALLDSLIIPVMPQIISRDEKGYDYLKKWIEDRDFWVRRSALLAQAMFFRKGGGGNKRLFFKLARSQFDEDWIDENYQDKEARKRAKFFIRKAIGWALREMTVSDPKAVAEFLKVNKKKMSGLSFREGFRKLPQDKYPV